LSSKKSEFCIPPNITGNYKNNSGIFDAETLTLNLHKNSTFSMTFSECYLKEDSGIVYFKKDTLYLQPFIKFDKVIQCVDSNLSRKVLKIVQDSGRLKILELNESISNYFLLTKQGFENEKYFLLGKEGIGYLRIIDNQNYTLEEGYYKNYNLYNGIRSKYDYYPKIFDENPPTNGKAITRTMTLTKTKVINGVEKKENN
jgi:hypothetical protein